MIRQANYTEMGLTGYVYTRDLAKGLRTSERIQAGMIGLNRGAVSDQGLDEVPRLTPR